MKDSANPGKPPAGGRGWFHRKVKTSYQTHLENVTPPEVEKPSLRHKMRAAMFALLAILGMGSVVAGPAVIMESELQPFVESVDKSPFGPVGNVSPFGLVEDIFQDRIQYPLEVNSILFNLEQQTESQPGAFDYVRTVLMDLYKELSRIMADPNELAKIVANKAVDEGAGLFFAVLVTDRIKEALKKKADPRLAYIKAQLDLLNECFSRKPQLHAEDIARECNFTISQTKALLRVGAYNHDTMCFWRPANVSSNVGGLNTGKLPLFRNVH